VSIILWIIMGALAGYVAKAILPGRDPGGLIVTVLIGIVGALLGGFIAQALFHLHGVTGFDLRTFIIAVLGSVVLLLIYRAVAGGRGRRRII
jgi:uncharacterized membrane protein YeaQ/YmgE (transglycosylase-associated protein family)